MLAAFLSITVLPAVLAILGPRVDALGVTTLLKVPFLANWPFSRRIIDWFAEKTQKTKTREEVEKGFWGQLVNIVMKRPIAFAAPILIVMTLLVLPIGSLTLAGISEKYLPPDNAGAPVPGAVRQALPRLPHRAAHPGDAARQTVSRSPMPADRRYARQGADRAGFHRSGQRPATPCGRSARPPTSGSKDKSVRVIQNGLVNRGDARAEHRGAAGPAAPARHRGVRRRHPGPGAGLRSTACSPSCR